MSEQQFPPPEESTHTDAGRAEPSAPAAPTISSTDAAQARTVDLNKTPYVAYTLMVITVAVFGLQFLTEQMLGVDLPALYGMKINSRIQMGEFWRLLTPMFLHGSVLHLGFNMYALYILGIGLERFYGHGRFILLYVLAAYAGNVMSFLMTDANSLGSSTAIFGLLSAQALLIYQNRFIFGDRSQKYLQNIIIVAAINFVIGLSPGIDNWGHLGGFVAGAIFAFIAGPKLRVAAYSFQRALVDIRSNSEVLMGTAADIALFSIIAAINLV